MRKSAKILVIAALVVSAIVMTSCSNLLTKISGKPSGTYEYKDRSTYLTYIFDGNDVQYKVKMDFNTTGDFSGDYITNIRGTLKLNGAKATVKYENSTIEHELISEDRWNTFSLLIDDREVAKFRKR